MKTRLLALAMGAFFCAISKGDITLFSSIGPAHALGPGSRTIGSLGSDNLGWSFQFEAIASGEVTRVSVGIDNLDGGEGMYITLRNDSANFRGAAQGGLAFQPTQFQSGLVTFDTTGYGLGVQAGQKYWIEMYMAQPFTQNMEWLDSGLGLIGRGARSVTGNTQYTYLDNIIVPAFELGHTPPVPEPSTLAASIVGAAMLLRRRFKR